MNRWRIIFKPDSVSHIEASFVIRAEDIMVVDDENLRVVTDTERGASYPIVLEGKIRRVVEFQAEVKTIEKSVIHYPQQVAEGTP